MEQLILVDSKHQTVSARDLHEKLEVSTRFNDWFPRMCDYGFVEGTDFYSKMSKTETGGRPQSDYDISIDMAKQICMIQRTEIGKKIRQYFLDLEKAWNTPEQVMARALLIANEKLEEQDRIIERQTELLEIAKPKTVFADAVSTSKSSILVGELAKLICQNGVEIGQKRLFAWLRDNGYLMKSGSDWNMPTQKSMDMGLFEIKESVRTDGNGCSIVTRTPKATGKGQIYFINKFIGEKEND